MYRKNDGGWAKPGFYEKYMEKGGALWSRIFDLDRFAKSGRVLGVKFGHLGVPPRYPNFDRILAINSSKMAETVPNRFQIDR